MPIKKKSLVQHKRNVKSNRYNLVETLLLKLLRILPELVVCTRLYLCCNA